MTNSTDNGYTRESAPKARATHRTKCYLRSTGLYLRKQRVPRTLSGFGVVVQTHNVSTVNRMAIRNNMEGVSIRTSTRARAKATPTKVAMSALMIRALGTKTRRVKMANGQTRSFPGTGSVKAIMITTRRMPTTRRNRRTDIRLSPSHTCYKVHSNKDQGNNKETTNSIHDWPQ